MIALKKVAKVVLTIILLFIGGQIGELCWELSRGYHNKPMIERMDQMDKQIQALQWRTDDLGNYPKLTLTWTNLMDRGCSQ